MLEYVVLEPATVSGVPEWRHVLWWGQACGYEMFSGSRRKSGGWLNSGEMSHGAAWSQPIPRHFVGGHAMGRSIEIRAPCSPLWDEHKVLTHFDYVNRLLPRKGALKSGPLVLVVFRGCTMPQLPQSVRT